MTKMVYCIPQILLPEIVSSILLLLLTAIFTVHSTEKGTAANDQHTQNSAWSRDKHGRGYTNIEGIKCQSSPTFLISYF